MTLPRPARYFPLAQPLYEVAAGLRPFGTDFGNGESDKKIFQFDQDFAQYRSNIAACRAERLAKYYQTSGLSPEERQAVARFQVERLCQEWPQHFQWNAGVLSCALTGDALHFSPDFELTSAASNMPLPYADSLDALCSQFPEDLGVVKRVPGGDALIALHLCTPSHWAAEDKIGQSFRSIHEPIPHVEKLNQSAPSLVTAMIEKGPYVRFVWGFATDKRLNHHPIPAPGEDAAVWKGRSFDESLADPFFLRVERQVTWGLPHAGLGLFFIRVSFLEGNEIRRNEKERKILAGALRSMSPQSRVYKGLETSFDPLLKWLEA